MHWFSVLISKCVKSRDNKKALVDFLLALCFTKFCSNVGKSWAMLNNNLNSSALLEKLNETLPNVTNSSSPLPIERMNIQFTCTVCGTKNNKYFSRLAYTKGTVIIQCDGCKSYHVIADNLGWIQKMEGKRNIEEILSKKGMKIERGSIGNIRLMNKNHTTIFKAGSKHVNISYIST